MCNSCSRSCSQAFFFHFYWGKTPLVQQDRLISQHWHLSGLLLVEADVSMGRQMCLWGGRSGALLQCSGASDHCQSACTCCVAALSPHCEVAGAVGTRTKERDGQREHRGLLPQDSPRQASPHQREAFRGIWTRESHDVIYDFKRSLQLPWGEMTLPSKKEGKVAR